MYCSGFSEKAILFGNTEPTQYLGINLLKLKGPDRLLFASSHHSLLHYTHLLQLFSLCLPDTPV